MRRRAFAALGALSLLAACQPVASAAETVHATPAALRPSKETGLKTAIFAGGCFWGVEGVFSHVKGVKSAVAGYHGGTARSAKYDLVSSGITDHAEAVRVTYDPAVVRYDQLLQIFFAVVIDPTTLNRQGPDSGSQYRSALVPMSEEQRAVAAAYVAQLAKSGIWQRPLVTKIERAQSFYPAETYHQDFMLKNPGHGYIRRWDAPKVAGLRQLFPKLYAPAFTAN